jgi:hypothetical protein
MHRFVGNFVFAYVREYVCVQADGVIVTTCVVSNERRRVLKGLIKNFNC